MRQVGTLPDADTARRLADYLATLAIETRLDVEGDGWAVWVCDEDRVPQAKQVFAEFVADPKNARFRAPARRVVPPEAPEEPRAAPRPGGPDPLEQPTSGQPPLTLALIFACVLVAALTNFGGSGLVGERADRDEQPNWWVERLSITEYHRINHGTMIAWKPGLPEVAQGEVWRLVTPIFLHFSLLHLLFNMLMLRPFGGLIEERRGAWRLALLVVVIAVVSNLAQYGIFYLTRDAPRLQELGFGGGPAFGGFSGVLYGLFGFIWIKGRLQPRQGLAVSNSLVVVMIAWFFLCLLGVVGAVANVCHAAGLLMGILLAWLSYLWSRVLG